MVLSQVFKEQIMRKSILIPILFIGLLIAIYPPPGSSVSASSPHLLNKITNNAPIGPTTFPPDVNPLTGLVVENPNELALPPALVSISTFPPSTRPQSGLSYSPWVFELFIGEGASRYLALFYGGYPRAAVTGNPDDNPSIGPIRSGRLPYESLRQLYNGFLVMASAYHTVAAKLNEFTNSFGTDEDVKGGNAIKATQLRNLAEKYSSRLKITPDSLSGMQFDPQPPTGGLPAAQVWYPVAMLNQVVWKYDPENGSYTRWQDNGDGMTFIQQSDKLNGENLAYENVVVLFAAHHRYAEALMDVDLLYIEKGKAVLFRDGLKFDLFWTTRSEEYERTTGRLRPIRFMDKEGNPFPFKPGQTWVHLTPENTPVYETIPWETDAIKDAQVSWRDHKIHPQEGSGYWTVDFYQPPIEPKK